MKRLAVNFGNKSLSRLVWSEWKRRYEIKLLQSAQEQEAKNKLADALLLKLIPKRCIRKWKSFVENQKEDRWREHRKQMLRDSVKVKLSR